MNAPIAEQEEPVNLETDFDSLANDVQEVDLSFGVNDKNLLIELVKPTKNSKILGLLKKNGAGPYHLCFEVSSIQEKETDLKKRGFICVLKPTRAIAFDNNLISFFFSKSLGLIELLEK